MVIIDNVGSLNYINQRLGRRFLPQFEDVESLEDFWKDEFYVDKDGSTKGFQILKGIGGGCDEEAVRVVKMMPKIVPGQQRGKPARVTYNLPMRFSLK